MQWGRTTRSAIHNHQSGNMILLVNKKKKKKKKHAKYFRSNSYSITGGVSGEKRRLQADPLNTTMQCGSTLLFDHNEPSNKKIGTSTLM